MDDLDRSSRSGIADMHFGLQSVRESLDNTGAKPWFSCLGVSRHADSIIAHRQGPVGTTSLIVNTYRTLAARGEGVLEGVDNQLCDDQPETDRCVRADNGVVDGNPNGRLSRSSIIDAPSLAQSWAK